MIEINIKYRAWDKDEKVMRDWAYLNNEIVYGLNRISDEEMEDSIFNDPDLILMPFTTLLDKENTEIYAGDIVVLELLSPDDPAYGCYGTEFVVQWNKGHWEMYSDERSEFLEDFNTIVAVQGNIYENAVNCDM